MTRMNERGEHTDDVLLSALIDGELPETEAARLQERIAREPTLAERYAALRQANRALQEAYGPVADEPLPARTLELLGIGSAAAPDATDSADERGSGNTRRSRARATESDVRGRRPWLRRRNRLAPASLAASAGVAFVAGVATAWLAGAPRPPGSGAEWLVATEVRNADPTLHRMLETLPSHESRMLSDDVVATLVLTFRTTSERYCRRFDLAGPMRSANALACRDEGGAWRLEAIGLGESRGPGSAEELYVTASAAGSSVVEQAIDERIAGDPLGRDAERELIAQGWTDAPR